MKIVTTSIKNEVAVQTVEPTHRIIVADCSGSMSYDLPKLRTMLKNKLPTMVAEDDLLTIVWFSGKNQFGVVFEAVKISSALDLSNVNKAIDRFLVPVCLTGFLQPLELVESLVEKYSMPTALSFMSDGWDNVNIKKNIIAICDKLGGVLASATFIEFGYYADSKMMLEMAESAGGSVILAEDFPRYEAQLEAGFKTTASSKKIKVHKVPAAFVVGNLKDGFVIAKPDAVGTVTLPSNTVSYSWLEGSGAVDVAESLTQESAYMVSALIMKGMADKALEVASAIGDVDLYNQVQNSFSKQDYALTVELANSYGSGKKKFYSTAPKATNLLPDENAYNVLTMLMDLAEGDGNYLDLSHESFSYKAGGDKRDTATIDDSGFKPEFKDKTDKVKAPITALKFDEDRPNINILVRREGTVTVPQNGFGFDGTVESFIWRNYTIVRDGIVNVRQLPVVLSKATYDLLKQNGVVTEEFKVNKTFVIDTKKFPIINRSMVGKVSSTDLFKANFELYKLQVLQKILKTKVEKPEFSAKFSALYGEEGTKFLKELGITEGGFSPKTVKGTAVDPYIAKVLEVKLSGLSSIPKIEDVEKAIAAGKALTPSQQVVKKALDHVATVKDYELALTEVKNELKVVYNKIVMMKFGIIVGKTWLTDMKDFDDNIRELDFGIGKLIKCQAVLSDKEV